MKKTGVKRYKKEILNSLFLIALALIALSLMFIAPKFNISGKVINEDFSFINKDNLGNYLEKENIVKDLPKDAVILLKLFNFNSGERQWEESYVIKKSSVKKGSDENPDIIITIHSKYISEIKDLCSAVKKANANRDLGYESKISNIKFLWKYKGILKYKDCLGM